ncbi:hypothetical protein LJC20_00615 [Eubacteriales bacterium OttesenSCG-928-M02]|nr:hypothetical protein [Eubacteriales bacterium OttesenSCG-928-M02]
MKRLSIALLSLVLILFAAACNTMPEQGNPPSPSPAIQPDPTLSLIIEAVDATVALDPGLNGGMEYIALADPLPSLALPHKDALLSHIQTAYNVTPLYGTYESLPKASQEGDTSIQSLSGILVTVESIHIGSQDATLKLEKYRGPLGAIWVTCTFTMENGSYRLVDATIDAIS